MPEHWTPASSRASWWICRGYPKSPTTEPKAREAWLDNAKHLHGTGLLTHVDLGSLENLCTTYALERAASAGVAKRGAVLSGGKINPSVRIVLRTSAPCFKLRNELGVTPTSRIRFEGRTVAPKPRDEFQEFLDEEDDD